MNFDVLNHAPALLCRLHVRQNTPIPSAGLTSDGCFEVRYQSEFARRYFGAGKAEGVAQGRVEIVLKLLATRYGQLSAAVAARVQGANTAIWMQSPSVC